MMTSSLVVMVLVLLFLLLREKFDDRRLQNGSMMMPVDGLQLAHDLRSPLMVLKSLLLEGEGFDAEKKELVSKLLDRMEEMTGLKRELNADHFKGDTLRHLSLKEIIDDVVEEKRVEYSDRKIDWKIESIENVLVLGKEYPLKRILSNLINNAVESLDGEGKISLEVNHCEQGNIILKIQDNGVGIRGEYLERIFKRGFTTKRKGQGLGLAHAKAELEKWCGGIEVESKVGGGTTVYLGLVRCAPSMVLLENEELIRHGWNMLARRQEKFLKTYGCSNDLFVQLKSFSKDTTFYLDEELGEKKRGRDIANELYKKGFRNIFITSGHPDHYFKDVKTIKGVVSKSFPS